MEALVYVLSSLALPGAAVAVRRKMGCHRFGWLMAATVVYVLFCAMVYGRCTGFLPGVAIVGWAFGLTYVQFCVIGNIWVPCTAVIAASGYLVYAAVSRFGALSAAQKAVRVLAVGAAAVQIVAMVMLLRHYAGTFDYAFYECVRDLKMIAAMFGTTYIIVNIVIYVLLGVILLALDIIAARLLLSGASRRMVSK